MISASAPPASGETRRTPRPRPSRRRTLVALASRLGSSRVAHAHRKDRSSPPTTASRHPQVVADQVQQVIGRPIIIDPRVRAQVTVLSNAPMSPDGFYRLFLSTLEVHGFVALDSGDAIQIVPDASALRRKATTTSRRRSCSTTSARRQLVPILRPLLPQSAHLAAHPPSNALIVADRRTTSRG